MSRPSFELLGRQISGVIHQFLSDGLQGAVSEEDAWRLFDQAWSFHHHHPSPDAQGLLVRAGLISHVTFAIKEVPQWQGIAMRGAYADGSIWFMPVQPEVKRLYALLLTNCAIAECCVYGRNPQKRAPLLASAAYKLFQQLESLSFPEIDQWVGRLYTVFAHAASDRGARLQYATEAWRLLGPLPSAPEELRVYVKRLAGR